ncbi:MAG: methyltransferase domain-containing protein [Alphaproteobacteria bacterium]|nr:methyltransferase domain-containing protein [Alphaproteobacteria bacterium]
MSGPAIAFDAQTSARVEALYRTPEVVGQRVDVLRALNLAVGESVIDIGVGPGFLAEDMAAIVGERGRVIGVDPSEAMLGLARARLKAHACVSLKQADAGTLPADDASLDAAVSTQVLEYVPDIPGALGEIVRVLKPGGRAVIIDTDYDGFVLNSRDAAMTARVLKAWDAHFIHRDLPRRLSPLMRKAGFAAPDVLVIPMLATHFQPHSYAHGMLHLMANFAVGAKALSRAEADAWIADFAALERDGAFYFCLNRTLFKAVRRP